jgi:hypothetical protein
MLQKLVLFKSCLNFIVARQINMFYKKIIFMMPHEVKIFFIPSINTSTLMSEHGMWKG